MTREELVVELRVARDLAIGIALITVGIGGFIVSAHFIVTKFIQALVNLNLWLGS